MQTDNRSYPPRPIVGVGAVIVDSGRVVLVKRRFEPLAGEWSLPGGAVEVGETLQAAIAREVLEETGLIVEPGPVIDVFDRILHDDDGEVMYHYVLIEFLCRPTGGALAHGSDVSDAILADVAELEPYRLTSIAAAIIERGLAISHGCAGLAHAEAGRYDAPGSIQEGGS